MALDEDELDALAEAMEGSFPLADGVLQDTGARIDIEDGEPGEYGDTGADDPSGLIAGGAEGDEDETGDQTVLGGSAFDSEEGTNYEDDRHALERKLAEASVGPDGGPIDGMERMVNFRNIQQREDKAIAPPVNINPESIFRAMLGREATVGGALDGTGTFIPEKPVEVVRWVGRDVETLPVSVVFAPVGLVDDVVVRPFVRLQFGTRGGATRYVEIDVGTGNQLTVPASGITVDVGLDDGSTGPFRLTASIGFYPIVRTAPLTRTRYLAGPDFGGGASITMARPAFASSLYAFERAAIAVPIVLEFIDAAGNVIYTRTIAAGAFLTAPILLANDIVAVIATNGSGATPTHARGIFGLSL